MNHHITLSVSETEEALTKLSYDKSCGVDDMCDRVLHAASLISTKDNREPL